MTEHGDRVGERLSRRPLRLGAVLLAVSAALVVAIQGNVGVAFGEDGYDEPLSWETALENVEPAEAYEAIPEDLQDFPWTWQERASQAAGQIRHTYPDDFSWFAFVPEGPGARIGFAGDVPDGAAGIIETLRSYGEEVEVFDDQKLTEHELLAANLYLTTAAQEASATPATVEMQLGDFPVILVAGATSEADAVGEALGERLTVVAEQLDAPTLEDIPVEFAAPSNVEPTDPAYDGMVVGPQPSGTSTR
jgi:hypothetical protein